GSTSRGLARKGSVARPHVIAGPEAPCQFGEAAVARANCMGLGRTFDGIGRQRRSTGDTDNRPAPGGRRHHDTDLAPGYKACSCRTAHTPMRDSLGVCCLYGLVKRDLQVAMHQKAAVLTSLSFFVLVVSLFPLG